MWSLISLIVVGLIAGALARLLVPGKQSMSILMTIVLGIVGSFVGGFLGALLLGNTADGFLRTSNNLIGSIIGAVVVLLIYSQVAKRRSSRV